MNTLLKRMAVVATAMVATLVVGLAPAEARRHAEGHGLRRLGMNALQARSAYQPTINQQGGRWIAYIGHHGGSAYNPQTRMEEPDGTSVVDVTNPRHPRYLTHTPRSCGDGGERRRPDGAGLQRQRPAPRRRREVLPAAPLRRPGAPDLRCETGIAYLVSGVPAGAPSA